MSEGLVERLKEKAATIREWTSKNKVHDWFPPGQAEKSISEADLWDLAALRIAALEKEVVNYRLATEELQEQLLRANINADESYARGREASAKVAEESARREREAGYPIAASTARYIVRAIRAIPDETEPPA